MGATSMTGPTPNRGHEAAALQRLGALTTGLVEVVQMAGAMSDTGKEVLKALNILTKLVPSGSVTPAAQKNNISQMAEANTKNNQQMQMLRQMMQQKQGASGAGQQPQVA